ncbi:MAG: primosomal protein N' [Bacilli bacterium]
MIASVLVEISNKNIDKTYDYLVNPSDYAKIKIGIRVLVPFNHQELEGFVLAIKEDSSSSYELKEVISVVDIDIVLNKELLDIGEYLHKTTLSTLISCYQVMLPKALKAQNGTNINIKIDQVISLNKDVDLTSLNIPQQEIVKIVKQEHRVVKTVLNKISTSSVSTLLKKGILKSEEVEHYRLVDEGQLTAQFPLTIDQQSVVDKVLSKRDEYIPYLLHGVTGSGKTEVYMEIIEQQLKQGKTSIVLVPEISLTPQIIRRFKGRFQDTIAVLHSRLSAGEKYDEWRKIVKGEVKIVIGARSAIFAPLKNIGVIIIDEEQTTSYYQDNNPRYNAIDVAFYRGKTHHCPVILGSATPTLESYARAVKGVYQLLELPNRVNNRPLPQVRVVNLNENKDTSNFYFSKELLTAIKSHILKQEQVLLLLNRRGYASYITCSNCGYTIKCPNCDIALTYHKTNNMLRCHYCGYGTSLPTSCPECHEPSIKNLGVGTEQIEELLHDLIPSARVIRMDFDTTTTKGSHVKIIESFSKGEYDILLGTQMIAKGLDFPNVTLVGVINADTSLNIPDFRSSEVTFQLLDQVAGRSGRGDKLGEVIIQTFNPDHYAIKYAKEHNYLGFYQTEMHIRKELKYSPYYYMTLIKISSADYNEASIESNKIATVLKRELTASIILGPTTSSMFKVNNIYHFQIILKYKKENNLYPVLTKIVEYYKSNRKVKIDISFNPVSFIS